jgi:probable rRNA maturation factor
MDGRNLNKNLDELKKIVNDDFSDTAFEPSENESEDDEDYDDAPIAFYGEDVEMPFTEAQEADLMAWIEATVAAEGREIGEITFIYCSDDYLLNINKEFLAHDYYTDVITFHYHETAEEPMEGDVYISTERTAENAVTAGVSHLHEVARVMVHGALHLCGYEDTSEEDRAAMREKENFYLAKLPII